LQNEYSLWTRNVETNGTLKVCEELGIGLVPFSPLGRGFLTGAMNGKTEIGKEDFRAALPRFTAEAMDANQGLVETLKRLAAPRKATPGQIARPAPRSPPRPPHPIAESVVRVDPTRSGWRANSYTNDVNSPSAVR